MTIPSHFGLYWRDERKPLIDTILPTIRNGAPLADELAQNLHGYLRGRRHLLGPTVAADLQRALGHLIMLGEEDGTSNT